MRTGKATGISLLALALVGCGGPSDEDLVAKCHVLGYTANVKYGWPVQCCSVLNGDSVCLHAAEVTKHRRETWPQ